jgi:hypothetical protein
VIIGVCLCLIGYAPCPVETGCFQTASPRVRGEGDILFFQYEGDALLENLRLTGRTAARVRPITASSSATTPA